MRLPITYLCQHGVNSVVANPYLATDFGNAMINSIYVPATGRLAR
jgi:hypothetical protein